MRGNLVCGVKAVLAAALNASVNPSVGAVVSATGGVIRGSGMLRPPVASDLFLPSSASLSALSLPIFLMSIVSVPYVGWMCDQNCNITGGSRTNCDHSDGGTVLSR